MASYSVVSAKHQTLVAATVDTIDLSCRYPVVEIINRSTTATDLLWATVSFTDPAKTATYAAATPSASGDNVYFIPAGPGHLVIEAPPGGYVTQVKLISAQTPAYSVQCYHRQR